MTLEKRKMRTMLDNLLLTLLKKRGGLAKRRRAVKTKRQAKKIVI